MSSTPTDNSAVASKTADDTVVTELVQLQLPTFQIRHTHNGAQNVEVLDPQIH
jgi:hypothetical protein